MRPRMNQSLSPLFHELDEYTFQNLCCDLFGRQPGIATCDVYGKRGQLQRGIDLLARRTGGDGIAVGQCKCCHEFPPTKIREASDDFFVHFEYWQERGVKYFILFVACDLDRTQQQEEIQKQVERFTACGIEYEAWSAHTLRRKLAPHRDIVSRHIKDAYWVDHICGPSVQPPSDQLQARPNPQLIVEFFNTQLGRLTAELSKYVKGRLEEIRERYREGHKKEALTSLQTLQQEPSWSVLEKSLQARILRTIAVYTLSLDDDISAARDLTDRARSVDPDSDDTIVRTLLRYHLEGPEAALQEIGTPTNIDIVNLEIALLLEIGRVAEARAKLERLPDGLRPDTETRRLQALMLLMGGDLLGAQAQIERASVERPRWEAIRVAQATINYFSALSQAVIPHQMVAWPEPINWTFVRRDDQSLQRLRKAEAELAELASDPDRDDESRQWLEVWRLACLANDPDRQVEAEKFCQKLLARDPTNHRALVWALARNYAVDVAASEKALASSLEEDENGSS